MTKVISLSDEAYNDLKTLKGKDKSFSDIVIVLANIVKKEKILSLAGAWSESPEIDAIFKKIFKQRHETKERELKL